MTRYGGLGGVAGGRDLDTDDAFELAVDRCMGERLRAEGRNTEPWFTGKSLGARLWGTMANAEFVNVNGDTASYSFRAAGDLIAAIVGEGEYMDWYCSQSYELGDAEV